jgi:hypothetical protein
LYQGAQAATKTILPAGELRHQKIAGASPPAFSLDSRYHRARYSRLFIIDKERAMNTESNSPRESDESLGDLGSLAQSARLKHLQTARGLLIFIGIITILVNGYFLFTARQQLTDEVRKQGMVIVDQVQFERRCWWCS